MSIKQLKAIELKSDDVILSVAGGFKLFEERKDLGDHIHKLWPDKRVLIIDSDYVEHLDEDAMNKLGWYRKADT